MKHDPGNIIPVIIKLFSIIYKGSVHQNHNRSYFPTSLFSLILYHKQLPGKKFNTQNDK